METRHPVEGQFGSEFSVISNHCGVMTAWSRKTLIFSRNFCVLWKKIVTVKFSKFCSENFHRDIDRRFVSKFREIRPTGNRWNRALLTWQKKNKVSLGSQPIAAGRIASKICQGQPPTMCSECSSFHPNRFTFGGVITERVIPRTKVIPIFASKHNFEASKDGSA